MPRAQIAGIAFERQASKNLKRMEMRSWWRCRSRRRIICRRTSSGRQAYQMINQSIDQASHRWLCRLPSSWCTVYGV